MESEVVWALQFACEVIKEELATLEVITEYADQLTDRKLVKLAARISRYRNAIRILEAELNNHLEAENARV